MKPFYIHFNRDRHRTDSKKLQRLPRGFTAFIEENPDDPRTVKMSVSFCSYKDDFVKKVGRTEASLAKVEIINKRKVPELLEACEKACRGHWDWKINYDYVWKYML